MSYESNNGNSLSQISASRTVSLLNRVAFTVNVAETFVKPHTLHNVDVKEKTNFPSLSYFTYSYLPLLLCCHLFSFHCLLERVISSNFIFALLPALLIFLMEDV